MIEQSACLSGWTRPRGFGRRPKQPGNVSVSVAAAREHDTLCLLSPDSIRRVNRIPEKLALETVSYLIDRARCDPHEYAGADNVLNCGVATADSLLKHAEIVFAATEQAPWPQASSRGAYKGGLSYWIRLTRNCPNFNESSVPRERGKADSTSPKLARRPNSGPFVWNCIGGAGRTSFVSIGEEIAQGGLPSTRKGRCSLFWIHCLLPATYQSRPLVAYQPTVSRSARNPNIRTIRGCFERLFDLN